MSYLGDAWADIKRFGESLFAKAEESANDCEEACCKLTLKQVQKESYEIAKSKGWWETDRPVMECLMLIVTEVSEAAEDFRVGKMEESALESGKPVGFPSELADIIIRVGDLAEHLGIDLESAVQRKMNYNATRPYRHGGKVC